MKKQYLALGIILHPRWIGIGAQRTKWGWTAFFGFVGVGLCPVNEPTPPNRKAGPSDLAPGFEPGPPPTGTCE